MIVRGQRLIAPKGNTVLENGDHVYIVAGDSDLPMIHLMFGRAEEL